MSKRIPRPSPGLVVALLALFVSLSGSAVAAGIVAHAKLADNATKLQGRSAAKVAALAPPPASLTDYVSLKSASFELKAGETAELTVSCDAAQEAIGGGYDTAKGDAGLRRTRPTEDARGWRIQLANASSGDLATGSVYAVCLR